MKKLWLLFAQTATVAVAALFVVYFAIEPISQLLD